MGSGLDSGDGEDKVLAYDAQWVKENEFREKAEQLLEIEGRKPSLQFEEAREGIKCEEGKKMEVHCELDSKTKLDQRKRELVKQMQKIDEITDLPQDLVHERKKMWRQELLEIEQIRNKLLPKYPQVQKL